MLASKKKSRPAKSTKAKKLLSHPVIIAALITAAVAVFTAIISKDKGYKVKETPIFDINGNQNSGQQAIIPNARDNNILFVHNQIADPNLVDKYGESQKALGKTENELEAKKRENQELQNVVNAYKQEDKGKRAALERAENIEKTKLIVRIFQEQDKGSITKEKALKFSDMVNKTLWEDLKSFIENKNIKIDEHNQSLVVSGIFKAEIGDTAPAMLPHISNGRIIYVLTPEGGELYEIIKDVNLE